MASDGFYDRNDSIAAFYNHSQRLVSNGPGESIHTYTYTHCRPDLT